MKSFDSYQCNSTQNVFKISKLCLENPDAEDLECMVPYDYSVLAFRYIKGYFLIIVAIICGIGNLLTLLSLSFAKKKTATWVWFKVSSSNHLHFKSMRRRPIMVLDISNTFELWTDCNEMALWRNTLPLKSYACNYDQYSRGSINIFGSNQ